MSKVDTYACNVCQVQKKEANHWFHAHVVGSGVVLIPWSEAWTIGGELRVHSESSDEKGLVAAQVANADAHLCGLEHALQWAGKQLTKVSAPPPTSEQK